MTEQRFTDEDKERLKVDLAKYGGANPYEVEIRPELLRALLARLEAAEKCIVADPIPYDERFQAWRQVSGK